MTITIDLEQTTPPPYLSIPSPPQPYQLVFNDIIMFAVRVGMYEDYKRRAAEAGDSIVVDAKYAGLPVVRSTNGEVTPVYEVVDVIDALIDYKQVVQQLPNVGYTQVGDVMAFLRKIAQFNLHGVDIDEYNDTQMESDPAFQEMMIGAVRDEESVRVLDSCK